MVQRQVHAAGNNSREPDHDDSDAVLGERLRAARQSQGKTLEEVAQNANVTRSFLSQVERGVASPSLTTLRRIAAELGVPIFLLLPQHVQPRNAIVHKSERQNLILPNSSTTYQLLSPDLNRKMEMIITALRVGCANYEEPFSHPGEECAFLLKGTVEIIVGEESFTLSEGDTLYFDATQPHRIVNLGSVTAEILSAITPPSF